MADLLKDLEDISTKKPQGGIPQNNSAPAGDIPQTNDDVNLPEEGPSAVEHIAPEHAPDFVFATPEANADAALYESKKPAAKEVARDRETNFVTNAAKAVVKGTFANPMPSHEEETLRKAFEEKSNSLYKGPTIEVEQFRKSNPELAAGLSDEAIQNSIIHDKIEQLQKTGDYDKLYNGLDPEAVAKSMYLDQVESQPATPEYRVDAATQALKENPNADNLRELRDALYAKEKATPEHVSKSQRVTQFVDFMAKLPKEGLKQLLAFGDKATDEAIRGGYQVLKGAAEDIQAGHLGDAAAKVAELPTGGLVGFAKLLTDAGLGIGGVANSLMPDWAYSSPTARADWGAYLEYQRALLDRGSERVKQEAPGTGTLEVASQFAAPELLPAGGGFGLASKLAQKGADLVSAGARPVLGAGLQAAAKGIDIATNPVVDAGVTAAYSASKGNDPWKVFTDAAGVFGLSSVLGGGKTVATNVAKKLSKLETTVGPEFTTENLYNIGKDLKNVPASENWSSWLAENGSTPEVRSIAMKLKDSPVANLTTAAFHTGVRAAIGAIEGAGVNAVFGAGSTPGNPSKGAIEAVPMGAVMGAGGAALSAGYAEAKQRADALARTAPESYGTDASLDSAHDSFMSGVGKVNSVAGDVLGFKSPQKAKAAVDFVNAMRGATKNVAEVYVLGPEDYAAAAKKYAQNEAGNADTTAAENAGGFTTKAKAGEKPKIVINGDSATAPIYQTLGHEIYHAIQRSLPENVQAEINNQITKNYTPEDIQEVIKTYKEKAGVELTPEKAREELAADLTRELANSAGGLAGLTLPKTPLGRLGGKLEDISRSVLNPGEKTAQQFKIKSGALAETSKVLSDYFNGKWANEQKAHLLQNASPIRPVTVRTADGKTVNIVDSTPFAGSADEPTSVQYTTDKGEVLSENDLALGKDFWKPKSVLSRVSDAVTNAISGQSEKTQKAATEGPKVDQAWAKASAEAPVDAIWKKNDNAPIKVVGSSVGPDGETILKTKDGKYVPANEVGVPLSKEQQAMVDALKKGLGVDLTAKTDRYKAEDGDKHWIIAADQGKWIDFNKLKTMDDVRNAAKANTEELVKNKEGSPELDLTSKTNADQEKAPETASAGFVRAMYTDRQSAAEAMKDLKSRVEDESITLRQADQALTAFREGKKTGGQPVKYLNTLLHQREGLQSLEQAVGSKAVATLFDRAPAETVDQIRSAWEDYKKNPNDLQARAVWEAVVPAVRKGIQNETGVKFNGDSLEPKYGTATIDLSKVDAIPEKPLNAQEVDLTSKTGGDKEKPEDVLMKLSDALVADRGDEETAVAIKNANAKFAQMVKEKGLTPEVVDGLGKLQQEVFGGAINDTFDSSMTPALTDAVAKLIPADTGRSFVDLANEATKFVTDVLDANGVDHTVEQVKDPTSFSKDAKTTVVKIGGYPVEPSQVLKAVSKKDVALRTKISNMGPTELQELDLTSKTNADQEKADMREQSLRWLDQQNKDNNPVLEKKAQNESAAVAKDIFAERARNKAKLTDFEVPSDVGKATLIKKDADGESIAYMAAKTGKLDEIPAKLLTKEVLDSTTDGNRTSEQSALLASITDPTLRAKMEERPAGDTVAQVAAEYGHADQIPTDYFTKENLIKPDSVMANIGHSLATYGQFDLVPEHLITPELLNSRDGNGTSVAELAARNGNLHTIPVDKLTASVLQDGKVEGEVQEFARISKSVTPDAKHLQAAKYNNAEFGDLDLTSKTGADQEKVEDPLHPLAAKLTPGRVDELLKTGTREDKIGIKLVQDVLEHPDDIAKKLNDSGFTARVVNEHLQRFSDKRMFNHLRVGDTFLSREDISNALNAKRDSLKADRLSNIKGTELDLTSKTGADQEKVEHTIPIPKIPLTRREAMTKANVIAQSPESNALASQYGLNQGRATMRQIPWQLRDEIIPVWQAKLGDSLDTMMANKLADPGQVEVAHLLKDVVGDTSVVTGVWDGDSAGFAHKDQIYLNLGEYGVNPRVLLHEGLHSATMNIMSRDASERTVSQNEAVAEIDRLYAHAKEALKGESHYGLTDTDEFVAEAFTNKQFQKRLSEIRDPMAKKSLWDSMVSTITSLFGLHSPGSLLHSTIAQTMKLTSEGGHKWGTSSLDTQHEAVAPSKGMMQAQSLALGKAAEDAGHASLHDFAVNDPTGFAKAATDIRTKVESTAKIDVSDQTAPISQPSAPWVDSVISHGPLVSGTEHSLYLAPDMESVIKVAHSPKKVEVVDGKVVKADATNDEYATRVEDFNSAFGSAVKTLGNAAGDPVTSMPILNGKYPTHEEVVNFLKEAGFEKCQGGYYSKDGFILAEPKPKDFVKDKSGNVLPIDGVVGRITPEQVKELHANPQN